MAAKRSLLPGDSFLTSHNKNVGWTRSKTFVIIKNNIIFIKLLKFVFLRKSLYG